LSWGDDLYVRKWDVVTGKAVAELLLGPAGKDDDPKQPKSPLTMPGAADFSPDGKTLVVNIGFTFRVFDVASGKERYQISNEGLLNQFLAISPDSRLLLANAFASAKNNGICLWELATQLLRKKVILPDSGLGAVAFSPNNKLFAAANGEPDCRISIWDMANGNEVGVVQGYRGRVSALAFTSDSKRLVSGMEDTTALVWDWKTKN
jgi:WD40 repeat protein